MNGWIFFMNSAEMWWDCWLLLKIPFKSLHFILYPYRKSCVHTFWPCVLWLISHANKTQFPDVNKCFVRKWKLEVKYFLFRYFLCGRTHFYSSGFHVASVKPSGELGKNTDFSWRRVRDNTALTLKDADWDCFPAPTF